MRIFGPNKSARYRTILLFAVDGLPALSLLAARYYTGKSSTCHTERRNTEREMGQVAVMVVLADGGGGGKQEKNFH